MTRGDRTRGSERYSTTGARGPIHCVDSYALPRSLFVAGLPGGVDSADDCRCYPVIQTECLVLSQQVFRFVSLERMVLADLPGCGAFFADSQSLALD